MRAWDKKLSKAVRMNMEKEPAMKEFTRVNKNLDVLESYEGCLSEEYWSKWVCNPYRVERGSFISHSEVLKVAEEMGETNMRKVEEIAVILEHGADIGVNGEG